MLEQPMLDPTGALIVELRSHASVAALVDRRVRGKEPAAGDAKGAGEWQAFVVVSSMSAPPHPRLPITFAEYAIDCYGATYQNAWAVYGAVVEAIHGQGVRTKANGLGIYNSHVIGGGEEDQDPDTKQPLVRGTIRLIATTAPVVTA